MFDVLADAYTRCWQRDTLPAAPALQSALLTQGWSPPSVARALRWLQRLHQRSHAARASQAGSGATRVLVAPERRRLGPEGWQLVHSLSAHGAIDPTTREQVLEAVMDTPAQALRLEDVRLIVCWVLWSQGCAEQALASQALRPACHLGLMH